LLKKDTTLKLDGVEYKFRKDDKFLLFFYLNNNSEEFTNQLDFNPYRHLQNDSKPITVFGGGKHLCPGRFFARNETKIYVAMLLHEFDVKLKKDSHPGFNFSRAGLQVSPPKENIEVIIKKK
jgi:cytochrome P450